MSYFNSYFYSLFISSRSKIFRVFLSFFSLISGQIYAQEEVHAPKTMHTVAITQIIQHPSLDLIRQGILDELRDQGFEGGKNLTVFYESAQGNISTAVQIAQKFVSKKPDVCVAIATPSAQTMLKAATPLHIPVVFGAVTDPVHAGLIKDPKTPSSEVTGTIDRPSTTAQVQLIQEILPTLKTLGIVYNAGEANTLAQIELLKNAAKEKGIKIVEATVARTSDVPSATRHVVSHSQALYVANDNTVVAALESLLKVADQAGIPVFTSDPESIERGALAAVANDQYKVGRATGRLVVRILQGSSLQDLPVVVVEDTAVYINEKTGKKLGISLPDYLLLKKKTSHSEGSTHPSETS